MKKSKLILLTLSMGILFTACGNSKDEQLDKVSNTTAVVSPETMKMFDSKKSLVSFKTSSKLPLVTFLNEFEVEGYEFVQTEQANLSQHAGDKAKDFTFTYRYIGGENNEKI